MSATFSPVDVDKDRLKEGGRWLISALWHAPLAFTLAALILGGFWYIFITGEGADFTSLPIAIVVSVAFAIAVLYIPVFLGSYVMYKVPYNLSWWTYWRNVRSTGIMRRVAVDVLVFSGAFVLVALMVMLFNKPDDAALVANVMERAAQSSEGDNLLEAYASRAMFTLVSLSLWLDMVNARVISMRSDLDVIEAEAYHEKAKKINPRMHWGSVAVLTVFIMCSLLFPVSNGVLGWFWGIALMLCMMLWIFILFGNTFPKPKSNKVSVIKPVEVS